jgi:alanine dehydrogenase
MEEGVVHYCVANMPGAYARTSTVALSNATIKYGLSLAGKGLAGACRDDSAIRQGLSTYKGTLTLKAVADTFEMQNIYKEPSEALGI